MVFYGIGGFCEAYIGAFGWNSLIFRFWYLSGAILVAAWLGQGTVYLLARRRWANFHGHFALASIFAAGAFLMPRLTRHDYHPCKREANSAGKQSLPKEYAF
jgi:hypothetical protein